jgi:hypothetical protein
VMATDRVRTLCFQMTQTMQHIMGASELEDHESSLRAVGRAYAVLGSLHEELVRMNRKQRTIVWPKGAQ